MERERKKYAEREHWQTVNRLKSICFKNPGRKEQTFANALPINKDLFDKAEAFVRGWDKIKRENIGLLFWGNVGTGKSYVAACIANALIDQEVSVLMRNMSDLVNTDFEDRDELCREIARYSLVVFDDFGVERETEYALEMLIRIINSRYESGMPTIITTNLSLNELKNPKNQEYQRIYDRVLEMCVPIYCTGTSIRSRIHEDKKNVMKEILMED